MLFEQEPVSVPDAGPLEQEPVSEAQGRVSAAPREQEPVSVPDAGPPDQEPVSEAQGQVSAAPREQEPVSVPHAGPREQEPVSVPHAGPREQELVSVPHAVSLEQGRVSVPLVGLEQRGDPGILSATLHPGHYCVVHKNSGHNADLLGVRANRDTLAEIADSTEDFPDTTQATSEHTSHRVSRYKWEDKSSTGPIRIGGRKSNTGCHSKTNHRCNRPTAY